MIYFGIDTIESAVKSQIEALRDSSQIVHPYSTLVTNVPGYHGSRVQLDRIDDDG